MPTGDPHQLECETLVAQLKFLNCFPAHIQVARCQDISIVNVADRPFAPGLIDTDTFVGFASNPHLALSIALTEYVERRVCRNNLAMPHANEGVAGRSLYPGYSEAVAREHARLSSLHEAIERYVWASWWDNVSASCSIQQLQTNFARGRSYSPLVDHIHQLFPDGKFLIIKPLYTDRWTSNVQIIFYFLANDAGVVSGGACGSQGEDEKTLFRALAEMMRHAQALQRAKTDSTLKAQDFYNRRLLYFGSAQGAGLARARLALKGHCPLAMPNLSIDEPITHPFDSAIVLHQSRFENQPAFIGGAVERLCL